MCRSRSMHVDTGKKFPRDVRLPRPLREGVEAQPHRRATARRSRRPTRPCRRPRARPRARPLGLQRRHRQARLHRHHRRHPPRRGGDARQGARLQPARRRRPVGLHATSRRNSGTSSTPTCRRARICASIRCCTGPSSTSGTTSERERHPGGRSLFRARTASATARSATRTSPSRSTATPRRSTRSSPSSKTTHAPERAGRAMDHEPRTPSSGCAPTGYM